MSLAQSRFKNYGAARRSFPWSRMGKLRCQNDRRMNLGARAGRRGPTHSILCATYASNAQRRRASSTTPSPRKD